jgi:hypothetical protein
MDLIDELIPNCYRQRVTQYLGQQWETIGSCCYSRYLTQGRGLALFAVYPIGIELSYLPWTMLEQQWDKLFKTTDQSMQQLVRKYVTGYDPDAQLAALFEFIGSDLLSTAMLIKGVEIGLKNHELGCTTMIARLSPKEAWELQRQG